MSSRNRGKKKIKARDLSRLPATNEEIEKLRGQLVSDNSPIVTAILGQALLENELDGHLRIQFKRRDDETWGRLNSDIGPFSSFHSLMVNFFSPSLKQIRTCIESVTLKGNMLSCAKSIGK